MMRINTPPFTVIGSTASKPLHYEPIGIQPTNIGTLYTITNCRGITPGWVQHTSIHHSQDSANQSVYILHT